MSTDTGQLAEAAAAEYLEGRGFTILARNHRTRWSELDIVAERAGQVHVVEVKYRRRADYGDGFAAITADKADRLRRAAAAWAADQRYGGSYSIDVVAVAGQPGNFQIELLEDALQSDR